MSMRFFQFSPKLTFKSCLKKLKVTLAEVLQRLMKLICSVY